MVKYPFFNSKASFYLVFFNRYLLSTSVFDEFLCLEVIWYLRVSFIHHFWTCVIDHVHLSQIWEVGSSLRRMPGFVVRVITNCVDTRLPLFKLCGKSFWSHERLESKLWIVKCLNVSSSTFASLLCRFRVDHYSFFVVYVCLTFRTISLFLLRVEKYPEI